MQNLEIFTYPIEPPKVSETSLQWTDIKNVFSYSTQNSYRPDLLVKQHFKGKTFVLCGVVVAIDESARTVALKMSPTLTNSEAAPDLILQFPKKRTPSLSLYQPYSCVATMVKAEVREFYPPLFYFDNFCVVEDLEIINDKLCIAKKNEEAKLTREMLKIKEQLAKLLANYLTWTQLLLVAGSQNPCLDMFTSYFKGARVTLIMKVIKGDDHGILCAGNPSERRGKGDVYVVYENHPYFKPDDIVMVEGSLVSVGFDPRHLEPHRVEANSVSRSNTRAFTMSKDISMSSKVKAQHVSLYQTKLAKWNNYLKLEQLHVASLVERWLHGEAKMGILGPVDAQLRPLPQQAMPQLVSQDLPAAQPAQPLPQPETLQQPQYEHPVQTTHEVIAHETEPWIPKNSSEIFPTSPKNQNDDNTWMSVIDTAMASAPAHQVYREEDDPSSQLYLERLRREQEIEERIRSDFVRKQNEDLIALEKNFSDLDLQPDPLAAYGLTKSQDRGSAWDYDADPFQDAPSYETPSYQVTYDTSSDPYLSQNPYTTTYSNDSSIDNYTPDVNSYILSSETPKIDLFGGSQQRFDDLDNLDFDFSKKDDYNYY